MWLLSSVQREKGTLSPFWDPIKLSVLDRVLFASEAACAVSTCHTCKIKNTWSLIFLIEADTINLVQVWSKKPAHTWLADGNLRKQQFSWNSEPAFREMSYTETDHWSHGKSTGKERTQHKFLTPPVIILTIWSQPQVWRHLLNNYSMGRFYDVVYYSEGFILHILLNQCFQYCSSGQQLMFS